VARQFKVVIADFITDNLALERRVLDGLAEIQACNISCEEELFGRVEDAEALMLYQYVYLSGNTINRLTRCKVIVCCGVGYDNVDLNSAREMGIPVANVPDYGSEEVADSAIGLTLALTRGIASLNARLRGGLGPWNHTQVGPLHRLRGRVFGVVGLGRIGTAAALRAKPLGMDVCFYDPYKPDGYDKALGVRRVEHLVQLLEQAFVLSLHCPLTPETRHMIDGGALSRMAFGSYLVNTARGAIVDTTLIPDAITSGRLAGAGIDVLEAEPPGEDHPLITAWRDPNYPAHHRVIVNPHSAFYCEEGLTDLRVKAAQTCRQALLGFPLRNVVN
jgi:C-terminal binding protein